MPGLQDRPHDSNRDRPGSGAPDSAAAASGLVMKSQLREADCPQTAFVEACGDLPPRALSQLLRVILNGRRQTGHLELEATEMLVRSAMHHAGATVDRTSVAEGDRLYL